MIHLRAVSKKKASKKIDFFPFNIPLIEKFKEIEFSQPVTFFVGENGSGKSTLLEAIAAGVGSISVGGEDIQQDKTLASARRLSEQLRFIWHVKNRRGFFLRAEDFFNFAKRTNQMRQELEEMASDYEGLAKSAILKEKADLVRRYGNNLDENSHGESFLKLFQSRFVPGGLYLLDEPEAPLSPLRQLSLISMLKEMINQSSQFIIVTHSPILMAFPGASILSFDSYPVKEVAYDEIEHVSLTKAFLNNPESFLQHL